MSGKTKTSKDNELVTILETIAMWPVKLYDDYKAKESLPKLAGIGAAALYAMYIQTEAFNADATGMLMGYALAGGVYYVGDRLLLSSDRPGYP